MEEVAITTIRESVGDTTVPAVNPTPVDYIYKHIWSILLSFYNFVSLATVNDKDSVTMLVSKLLKSKILKLPCQNVRLIPSGIILQRR